MGHALFGLPHLAALLLTVVVPCAMVLIARMMGGSWVRGLGLALAGLLVINKIVVVKHAISAGVFTPQFALPMHLCDWATVVVIWTLCTRARATYELAYFWGFAGTMQALLTPDLPFDFPAPEFFTFFISHGGIVAAVLYLTFAFRLRPEPPSLVRAVLWSQVYFASALLVNWIFEANYGYLCAKPLRPSLLDLLAPWPWYLLQLQGLMVMSYLFCYSPFWIADRWRKRRVPEQSGD